MPVGTTLYVRNKQAGPTILSLDPKGSEFVEWQGAGDANGGDIQIVPESFHNHPNFLRAVQRGILVIENDEAAAQELVDKQNAAWHAQQAANTTDALASIDPQANNDLVSLRCVGPDQRGNGQCETEVPVRDLQKDEKPPLCATHRDLEPQYVPDDVMEGGKSVRKWRRATMGPRETQQA